MGTALRAYKDKHRGAKLSDGKENKGKTEAINKAICAIFARPTTKKPTDQHPYCAEGSNSWFKYESDVTLGSTTYNAIKCLPFIFLTELKPIFERITLDDFLTGQGLRIKMKV